MQLNVAVIELSDTTPSIDLLQAIVLTFFGLVLLLDALGCDIFWNGCILSIMHCSLANRIHNSFVKLNMWYMPITLLSTKCPFAWTTIMRLKPRWIGSEKYFIFFIVLHCRHSFSCLFLFFLGGVVTSPKKEN